MRVADIMHTDIVTVTPTTSLHDAAKTLIARKVSGLPVVEGDRVVGVLSEKDIFRALYPSYEEYYIDLGLRSNSEQLEERASIVKKLTVAQVMTAEVVAVTPDTPLMKVGAIMLARKIHRIIVVDKGKLVGILTRRDVYSTVFAHVFGKNE